MFLEALAPQMSLAISRSAGIDQEMPSHLAELDAPMSAFEEEKLDDCGAAALEVLFAIRSGSLELDSDAAEATP